jgi:hypothetical protein
MRVRSLLVKPTIPRSEPEFLLNTFRQTLEKIQKLDASIEVLKGVMGGVVERDRGPEAKAEFLKKFGEVEREMLAERRLELDRTIETLRHMLTRGSLPDA